MELTLQRTLMLAGLFALLAGVITAVVAARTYARLDIRAVRDDLSGKTRQRIMAEHRVHALALVNRRLAHPVRTTSVVDEGADCVPTVVGVAAVSVEPYVQDGLPTQVHEQAKTQDANQFVVTRDVCQVHCDSVIGTREAGRAW